MTFETGFRCVVFDCDSTLVKIEGIDELAGTKIDEIRGMTDLAMDGAIPLEEVYGRRLALIDPTRAQVDAVGEAYVRELVDDARDTVAALLELGKTVRIVSGGLLPPVLRVAAELGIAPNAIAAVGIEFDAIGHYLDFQRDSPLARSGGKADVLKNWSLPRPALLVGDGATDLEGRGAVDLFVAFMGIVHRPAVAREADVVLTAPSLAPILALAADAAEREWLRDSPWADLLQRGEEMLAAAGAPRPDA
jgi:phosphoserine phosphatase